MEWLGRFCMQAAAAPKAARRAAPHLIASIMTSGKKAGTLIMQREPLGIISALENSWSVQLQNRRSSSITLAVIFARAAVVSAMGVKCVDTAVARVSECVRARI